MQQEHRYRKPMEVSHDAVNCSVSEMLWTLLSILLVIGAIGSAWNYFWQKPSPNQPAASTQTIEKIVNPK